MNRTDALKLLNLQENCSQDDIKASYRELTLRYHPDKNKDGVAHEAFIMIKKAYDYLSDKGAKKSTSTNNDKSSNTDKTDKKTAEGEKKTEGTKKTKENKTKEPPKPDYSFITASYVKTISTLIKQDKLQDVCNKLGIAVMKLSPTTHRPVKKTKAELCTEIVKTSQTFRSYALLAYDSIVTKCQDKKLDVNDKSDKPKPKEELIFDLMISS